MELGLERVHTVARRLSLDKPNCPVVTVAGTNGKGSTCALLEAMARSAGKRVGVFTSPHLLRYNERIRIDAEPVADAPIISAFERIEEARGDISLTYFEFGTLAALWVFAQEALDLMVLEVGLGGRLDAVNIVDPSVAVITSISLDHEAWLGSDRETIGREKAGILRPGIDAVIADADPPASVANLVAELGCRAEFFDVAAPQDSQGPLRPENLFAATAVARKLGFAATDSALPEILESLHLPGRLQQLSYRGRSLVLDVAHNPAAVDNLAGWLQRHVPGPRVALFAVLSDKNIHAMMPPCFGVFQHWYLPALPGVERAQDNRVLAEALEGAGMPQATLCDDVTQAWERIRTEHPDGTVVVFGSFFTVAGFMKLLGEGRTEA
jgi:dihydrofolate synthase/folylpolyglutamate synthase